MKRLPVISLRLVHRLMIFGMLAGYSTIAAAQEAQAPNLEVEAYQRMYLTDTQLQAGLLLYNLRQARLSLYHVTFASLAPDAFALAKHDPEVPNSLPHRLKHLDLSAFTRVRQWMFTAPEFYEDSWMEHEIVMSPLPGGVYVLVAEGGGIEKRTWFAVSSRAMVVKRAETQVLAWLTDAKSGQPQAEVPVVLIDEKGQRTPAVTNREGLASFPAPPVGINCFVVTQKGDPAFCLTSFPATLRPYEGYIYTDRPIYRPGQSVNFRGTVRERQGSGYQPVSSAVTAVKVQIKARGGSTVYEKELPLNDWGSFADEFQLAPEPPLGSYELVTTVGHGAKETRFFTRFDVEAYRKPEFTVDVQIPQPHYLGGETVEAVISAKYFFGSPVSGGKVEYDLRFTRSGSGVSPRTLTAAGLGTAAVESIEDSIRGQGRLDKDGRLVVSIPTKRLPFDRYLQVSATVSETALRPRSASTGTLITAAAFRLHLSIDKYEYLPGETVKVKVETKNHDAEPISAAVNVVLVENLIDREKRSYQERTVQVVETDSRGEALVSFPVQRIGSHELEAWGLDDHGNPVEARARFSVVKERPMRQWPALNLSADQDSYRPGDTAVLHGETSLVNSWALVTVEGDDIHSAKVYGIQANRFTLRIPLEQAYQPNVNVTCTIIRDGEITETRQVLLLPPHDRRLTVIVTPNQEQYTPAETAAYTIVTRDSRGAAVPAEVGLGVVDASVYEIRADTTADVFDAWWGPRRHARVRTDHSLSGMYPRDRYMRRAPAGPMGAPTMELMEDAEAARGAMGGGADGEAPQVRRFFTDTAYWGPSVVTGADGSASIEFLVPDNLTTWRATARGMTKDDNVGETRKDVVVTMPLLVRLTLPRFYVEGDEATAAATVHNYTGSDRTVNVTLTAEGVEVLDNPQQTIELANEGIKRLTWRVKVTGRESARFLVSADGGPGGKDAMESTIPVQPDGVRRVQAVAGLTRERAQETLTLPQDAVAGSGLVEVTLSPSLAGPIFEALEFLTNYPYGCAEQTMGSFLPNVIVADTLEKLGTKRPRPKMLDRYTNFGLQKLLRYQHADGGWHWWEFDDSDPYVSAYIVYGLKVADDAGYVAARDAMIRGVGYLVNVLPEEQYRDARAYLLWALAFAGHIPQRSLEDVLQTARDLYEEREKLSFFNQASLARALNRLSQYNDVPAADRAAFRAGALAIVEDLEARTQETGVGGYWAADGRYRYSWLDNNVEVTAQVLMALLEIKPESERIVPAVRWLMAARSGKQWTSTKDTAAAVMALTRYLEQSDELEPAFTARVYSGEKLVKEVEFTADSVFEDPARVAIPALDLATGENSIRIEKEGEGVLYYTARLSHLQSGEAVVPTDEGIKVERRYRVSALDPVDAGTQEAGDVIFVEVTISTDRNLRYALIQEPIPAGCEVIDQDTARIPEIGAERREVWDNRLVLYFNYLPRGERTFTYALRAEAPGNYRILPSAAELMYFPEVRGHSRPVRVIINDVTETQ